MKRKMKWIVPLVLLALLAGGLALYVQSYYRADDAARAALSSDGAVRVEQTDYGWRFDGPSEESALIFYPGGKVEETAYAPLLHRLAEEGMDACLVRMPARLAILGIDRAAAVMEEHDYRRWIIGGHSLGGAAATAFASRHPDRLSGVALLAAYPMKPLDDALRAVLLYGSRDGVLNMEKYVEARPLAPADAVETVIEGGNHAQFGAYGPQKGDGEATISADEQRRQAVRAILEAFPPEGD